MPRAGLRKWSIVFQRNTPTEDGYGGQTDSWATYASRKARVRFGTAQEKREAAQEGGVQSATFECVRSATLDAVTLKDRIVFDSSNWDITERAPLDPKEIRFTATRTL